MIVRSTLFEIATVVVSLVVLGSTLVVDDPREASGQPGWRFESAYYDGASVHVQANLALRSDSTPTPASFIITRGGEPMPVQRVTVDGPSGTLSLGTAATLLPSDDVRITYAPDGAAAIVGPDGQAAGAFDLPVTVPARPAETPHDVAGAAVAWTGTGFILAGGVAGEQSQAVDGRRQEATDEIYVDDDGTWRRSEARLPTPRAHMAYGWAPDRTPDCPAGCMYLFGGRSAPLDVETPPVYLDEILRYDPAGERLTLLDARLPFEAALQSAVWTGSSFVLVGGRAPTEAPQTGSDFQREGRSVDVILRFDPTTRLVAQIGTLPFPMVTRAVWAPASAPGCLNGCVYVLGGWSVERNDVNGGYWDTILRHDPATGLTTPTGANMPKRGLWTSAVWTGEAALMVNGILVNDDGTVRDHFGALRIDPVTGQHVQGSDQIGTQSVYAGFTSTDDALVLMGGDQGWIRSLDSYFIVAKGEIVSVPLGVRP